MHDWLLELSPSAPQAAHLYGIWQVKLIVTAIIAQHSCGGKSLVSQPSAVIHAHVVLLWCV
jgi:hypothetical protein